MSSTVAFAQSGFSSDGLELLTRVTKHYASAGAYYIESVEERTRTGAYSRDWQKTVLTAAESPGDRFYYEGRSNSGSAKKVGDGKTVWTYRVSEHRYTVNPKLVENSIQAKITPMAELSLMQAEGLRKHLGDLAKSLKSAERLPDATLNVNGHDVSCFVVRVQASDQKRAQSDSSSEKIMWIDKKTKTFMRMSEHAHTYMISGAARIPIEEEIATTFTNTVIDGPIRVSLFRLIPPSDAKLVQEFLILQRTSAVAI